MKRELFLLARTGLATLALFMLPATHANAANVNATGELPRDTSKNYFEIEITVKDAKSATVVAPETDLFKSRIKVWITSLSSTDGEHIPFDGEPERQNVPFRIQQKGDIGIVPNSHNLYDLTYHAIITETLAGELNKLGASTKLKITYTEGGATSNNDNITIMRSSAIVSEAPTGIATSASHHELIITWTAPSMVAWTDGTPKAPSKITVLAIDKTTLNTDLPAYIYNSEEPTDTAAGGGTCTFNPDFTDGDQCVTCTDENAYLDPSKLELLTTSGIFTQTTSSVSSGKTSFTGLENDKPYAVVSFYQPGGLKRSSCVTGTPKPNTSYSEANGEDPASLLDPKCFIATAAYGSPLHKNLKPLRWFRDRVLLKTKAGSLFVAWYYERGPHGARFINEHPVLKPFVQGALWMPVMLLTGWMTVAGNDPSMIAIVFSTFLAALITATYVAHKTREEA